MTMGRRQFMLRALGAAIGGPGALALVGRGDVAAGIPPSSPGSSPYGPLAATPDRHGLLLPAGFTARVVATAGEPVGGTDVIWPPFPDGAGVVPAADGGWWYTCNSNVMAFGAAGSVSGVRFAPTGDVVDAFVVLNGSSANSGGCTTPWGTWLSVEEDVLYDQGLVWECDPTGERLAVRRPALGRFSHHSVVVDPDEGHVYLSQAHPLGLLYRFTPTTVGDLRSGVLEACVVDDGGGVSWSPVSDPLGADTRTRDQVPSARRFAQGGGMWIHDGWLYLATELDHAVHGIDLRDGRYRLVWEGDPADPLSHCDVMAGFAQNGDLVVGSGGAAPELVVVTAAGAVAPLLGLAGPQHEGSRLTGPVFDPSGTRLYVSSQRAVTRTPLGEIVAGLDGSDVRAGVTYEITGPFVGAAQVAAPPVVATTIPVATTLPAVSTLPADVSVPASVMPSAPTSAAVSTEVAPVVRRSGTVQGFALGLGTAGVAVAAHHLVRRGRQTEPTGGRAAAEESVASIGIGPDTPSTSAPQPAGCEQLELPFDVGVDWGRDEVGSGSDGLLPRPDIGARPMADPAAVGTDTVVLSSTGVGGVAGATVSFDLDGHDPDRLHTPDEYTDDELEAMAAEHDLGRAAADT